MSTELLRLLKAPLELSLWNGV